ncbi:hypothetical protein [Streptomyces dioscori]|uniref:hypothetical protein n=1 Tax=Streptomyces dioscori TaxID=2109333 RepID=UPI0018FE7F60|nr:hypothetical protein [Streptomyces dioscori]
MVHQPVHHHAGRAAPAPGRAGRPAREGVTNALTAADGSDAHAQALVRAAQESFVDGWQQAMWAGAAVMAILFVHVLARGPKGRKPAPRAGGGL